MVFVGLAGAQLGHLFFQAWELQDLSLSPVSGLGPEIADVGGLNGPLLPQSPLEKVGGEAPHLSQWGLR